MILSDSEIEKLLKKYCATDEYFELVSEHGEIVWKIAEWCVGNIEDDIDLDVLEVACKLHDIASPILMSAEGNDAKFKNHYGLHSVFGEAILKDEGLPKEVYQIVGTHNLMGMTKDEIINNKFVFPHMDRTPMTLEGELLCYADRFHSKRPVFNDHRNFKGFYGYKLPVQDMKFRAAVKKFGMPDIDALAKKYGHPIR